MPGTISVPSSPGKGPANIVVDAGGAGDYTEINLACAGANPGDTIAVLPGTYVETGDIVPKFGQTIVGWGGKENNQVQVQLGNNIIDISAGGVGMFGLYIEITATADKSFVDITDSKFTMRDCTLDFLPTGGAQQCRGIYADGTDTTVLRDITIYCDSETYRVIEFTDSDHMEITNCQIIGGTLNPSAVSESMVYLEDIFESRFSYIEVKQMDTEKLNVPVVVSTHTGVATELSPNIFNNIKLPDLSNAGTAPDGIRIDGNGTIREKGTIVKDCYIYGGATQIAIDQMRAVSVNNCDLRNKRSNATARGVYFTACENCSTNGVKVEGFTNAGYSIEINNSDYINVVDFQDYDLSGTTKSMLISGGSVDYNVTGCVFDDDVDITAGDPGQFTGCTFEGSADVTISVNSVSFAGCAFQDVVTVGGTEIGFAGCRFSGTVNINNGADRAMFAACNFDFTVNCTGDTCAFVGCQIQTLNTAVTANVNGVMLSGCRVSSFTNGSANNANFTHISACQFGTFTDNNGFSTIRDEYTMENVTANWSVRMSRHYHNDGAVGAINGTLPTGPLDGVKLKITCMTAQTIKLTAAAGDKICMGATVSAAAGTIESNTPYSSIELVCIEQSGNDLWIVLNAIGSWTVT